ncbi:MAG: hypothetical protein CMF48_03385 [Legionellales bacterium]|nr:hypothetical protein [Legionellales bacterium]|tara:strand:+ start:1803 stop:3038 length:1236 start_codon:yes stop_codon:yes gene_type:complete
MVRQIVKDDALIIRQFFKRLHMLCLSVLIVIPMPATAEDDHHNHSSAPEHQSTTLQHNDENGDEHTDEHGDEDVKIKISKESMDLVGIKLDILRFQESAIQIDVPGEVIFNNEKTAHIEPRISAQIIAKYVYNGEHVAKDQPLVKLSSVEVAKAQSELLFAAQDWHRVKNLVDIGAVSQKDHNNSKIQFEHSFAMLQLYGISKEEIESLVEKETGSAATGEFNLLSPMDGTIVETNVTIGNYVDEGKTLYKIIDESSLWVNASTPSSASHDISVGQTARVKFHNHTLVGTVSKIYHTVDEVTRRKSVLIEILDSNEILHPGDFVEVSIELSDEAQAIVVPEQALSRVGDGDWVIYLQNPDGTFSPVEIERLGVFGKNVKISGVEAGMTYVSDGAFYVHSEAQKDQFEVHNH